MALLLICSICVSCEVLSIKTIYCKLVVNNVKWSFSGYKTHYFHYKNKKEFYESAQLHQLTWNREYFFSLQSFLHIQLNLLHMINDLTYPWVFVIFKLFNSLVYQTNTLAFETDQLLSIKSQLKGRLIK